MSRQRPKILYLSHATEDLYEVIRQEAGADFELRFLEADDDGERCLEIADCDAVICAATPLRQVHLDAALNLKAVHHQGVGWQDTTDWEIIRDRGIPLALTSAGTTTGVAEHTVLLMLAAAKRLSYADAELRQGRWHVNALRGSSRELAGKCVGYIGMGRIAQAVAERLKSFGCSGIYCDPGVDLDAETARALGLAKGDLDAVLAASDFLTLHLPLTAETRNIVSASALEKIKPGAVIVNTARGGLIDEAALAAALKSGRVLAAGLDVFEEEPPTPENPLLGLSNVVLTPHISAGTEDAMRQKMAFIFMNLKRFFETGEIENRVVFP